MKIGCLGVLGLAFCFMLLTEYWNWWSGERDETFIQPFRNALVEHLEHERPVALSDFTQFEWEKVYVFGGYTDLSYVWDQGLHWPLYSFVHISHDGYTLWVFELDGEVTKYATANYQYTFSRTGTALPLLAPSFRSLSKDEAVFQLVRLEADGTTLLEEKHFIVPVKSDYRENSWRGVYLKCIYEKAKASACWNEATDAHPSR